MSDNPQHDYIISTLELIRDKQFWDTDPNVTDDQRKRLQEALSDHAFQLRDTYEKERAIVEGLSKEDKRRKEFEKNTENLAKALPNITKGTLTAITAFQKDDPISGSAAIMDICASLAPYWAAWQLPAALLACWWERFSPWSGRSLVSLPRNPSR